MLWISKKKETVKYAAAFIPRRSPRFTEQTQCQDNEHAAEASRRRKGKAVMICEVVPISGNDGTEKETETQTATSIETAKALSKDSSGGDFRKRPRKETRSEVVRCCIPVKHVFKSLTFSLRSKQEVEEDRVARRVRNHMNQSLRLQESLLARRRSSRIEQARLIRENPSCDGLVDVPVRADIPLTFASSGFFDLPGATSSRGIKRDDAVHPVQCIKGL
ncbi:hypothetical protein C5167_021471 [Papaver somniferum]|nr:hypothetical protein C5167_021471 [Papaver somniferum]